MCADERLLQVVDRLGLAQPRRRLERVEAGVGEVLDRADLLDRHAVDLLDLADEEVEAAVVGDHHRELVDRDAVAPLDDVDADDVAADRTDAGGDETQRTGPVGEPDPDRTWTTVLVSTMVPAYEDDASVSDGVNDTAHSYTPPVCERIGVLGGTFDPVHTAHVVVAAEVRAALDLDRVLLVVAGDPWQKRGEVVASARTASCWSRPRSTASTASRRRRSRSSATGASVTADTLEALPAPDRTLFLVLGADAVANMCTWRRLDDTRHLAKIVVVERAGDRRGAPRGRVAGRAGGDPPPRHLVDRPARSPGRRPPDRRPGAPGRRACHRGDGPLHWRLMTTGCPLDRAGPRRASRAAVAARAAADKKGTDLAVLDVGDVISIIEMFVLVSATNMRQVRTIVDEVEHALKIDDGIEPISVEGLGDAIVGAPGLRRHHRARVPRRDPRVLRPRSALGRRRGLEWQTDAEPAPQRSRLSRRRAASAHRARAGRPSARARRGSARSRGE